MVQQTFRTLAACLVGGLMFCSLSRADELSELGGPGTIDAACQKACESKDWESCCGPRWTVGASALILDRVDSSGDVLAFDFLDPAANLNGEDFDFGFQGGFELALIRHTPDSVWPDVEVRFFALDSWSEEATVPVTAGNPIQINNTPPTFVLGPVSAIDARYASQLYNTELNLRGSVTDRVTALAGLRYLELDERLGMAFAGTPVTYDVAARNRLYGVQAGLDYAQCFNRVEVNGFGKAGIYGNAAGQDTVVWTGAFAPTAQDEDGSVAFVGELGINGKLWVTDHLALLAGYRLLWVEGVALASDQIAATDLTAQTGIDTDGGVFYHGVVLGLEGAW